MEEKSTVTMYSNEKEKIKEYTQSKVAGQGVNFESTFKEFE